MDVVFSTLGWLFDTLISIVQCLGIGLGALVLFALFIGLAMNG